ncbi:MAG: homoserine kinase [Chloroflexota bacterium]
MIVKISVPATTANLGPGFDCLGLALDLCNSTTLMTVESANRIEVSGEGAEQLPTDSSNLVLQAAEKVFTEAGKRPAGVHVRQENEIPVGSGLGSSASAVLGGMLAANVVIGTPLSQQRLLELASEFEGHPDNVVPAMFGGLTLAVSSEAGLVVERIEVPYLKKVIVVLPDFALSTSTARKALPDKVPLADAVFNIGRVGLLVRAFETGDYGRLAIAMEDRVHQPYRLPLIPGMPDAFEEARRAGAAVALSGAGPSVVAFARDNHSRIAAAMGRAFVDAGLRHRTWILPIQSEGCRVEMQRSS